MLIDPGDDRQVIRFSLWRTLGVEVFVLALSILPLIPGFNDGLRYTAVFYRPAFYPILVASSIFLGIIFCALLPLLWRALLGLPAVELSEGSVRIYGAFGRSILKSDIRGIDGPKVGNLTIKVAGGRDATLPLFLYKNAPTELRRIKKALN